MMDKQDLILCKSLGLLHDNLIRPFNVLLRKYEKRDRAISDKGYYKFVQALGKEIAIGLLKIYKNLNKTNPTLIDIGCGIGNIVALATSLGYTASGIEIDELYTSLGNPYNNIVLANLLELKELKADVIFT